MNTTANTVNLLVELGTMMVSLLTGTGNRELDTGRMPSSDTSNLTKTLVSLTGEFTRVPTRSDALGSQDMKINC